MEKYRNKPTRYPREFEAMNYSTARLKVPGGWVVESADECTVAICFVPDPKHEWILEVEPNK